MTRGGLPLPSLPPPADSLLYSLGRDSARRWAVGESARRAGSGDGIPFVGDTMFDPFPTFPLPPCNAFGGPPMELPHVGLCAIPKHHTPDGRWHHDASDADPWRERVEGGDWAHPLAGYEDCDGAPIGHHLPCSVPRMDLCNDGPAPLVTDGHYEGDPAPVIGWAL